MVFLIQLLRRRAVCCWGRFPGNYRAHGAGGPAHCGGHRCRHAAGHFNARISSWAWWWKCPMNCLHGLIPPFCRFPRRTVNAVTRSNCGERSEESALGTKNCHVQALVVSGDLRYAQSSTAGGVHGARGQGSPRRTYLRRLNFALSIILYCDFPLSPSCSFCCNLVENVIINNLISIWEG